jgi:hypothetical protein
MTAQQYRDRAVRRMTELYGPKPQAMRVNPINLIRRRSAPR